MKKDWSRFIDGEGVVHASGPHIAVNIGLCATNDFTDETDEPVDCHVCIEIDRFVRAHRALSASPEGETSRQEQSS